MPEGSAKTSRPILALLLGLSATLAAAMAHVAGLDAPAERNALDFRFRYFGTVPLAPEIVHVDIDDRSLDELGRWPWPREQLAGMVETLQECGARAVALDIIMPEPQEVRYESPAETVYAFNVGELVGDVPPVRVFDDEALASVLKKHPDVSLPMHLDLAGVEALSSLRRQVGVILESDPTASLPSMLNLLAKAGAPAGDDARREYLRCRSILALRRLSLPLRAAGDYPLRRGELVPPLVRFAEVIAQTGFVTVQPDADGVVRRIALLAETDGRAYPQFALTLAAQELAARHGGTCGIAATASGVLLRCGDGWERRIPVDRRGAMLISWQSPADLQAQAGRLSAAAVGEVWRAKNRLRDEAVLPRIYHVALAQKLGVKEWQEAYRQADELYLLQVGHRAACQRARLYDPQNVPPAPKELSQEKQVEQRIARALEELFDDFLLEGVAAAEKKLILETRRAIRAVEAGRKETEKAVAEKLAALRRRVEGKICLVGSTATGAADFVPTPVSERLPGVTVHGNILNTILSGKFVTAAHPMAGILTILLAGAAVSLLAALRPILQAGPLAVLLGAVYAFVNAAAVFGAARVHLPIIAPLGAMAASLLVVTAFRQLTEERAKRHIRGLFAHALSPQLVDKLIEDPSLASLGGQKRDLTCLFSDLAGFTQISERLGERKTVRVLNRYFDLMTEVVQNRCGGYLNKFLGDGIFVFFGAPVMQDDHPARAVRAAVECQQAVARFNETIAEELEENVRLTVRVGVATGEVMVGNCGSTHRMDYTAIGDTVNLSSRLEGANKFFGTRILAAQSTWLAAGGEEAGPGGTNLLARPLGQVQVVGKTEPVAVWNIIGPLSEATEEAKQAFADFAGGVELFVGGQLAAAASAFESVLAVLPGDRPAEIYLDLCRTRQAAPPGGDFSPVIRLTEK